jgi:hypothetical protein
MEGAVEVVHRSTNAGNPFDMSFQQRDGSTS